MEQLRKIVVCDIDNTVAVLGQRRAEMLREPVVDWDRFYADAFDDKPMKESCQAVRRLLQNGVKVVFSTSRRESVRVKTLVWLRRHISDAISDEMLLMRPNGCNESEAVQKVGGVLSKFSAGDIALVIDDNDSILDAWSAIGVPVLKAETVS